MGDDGYQASLPKLDGLYMNEILVLKTENVFVVFIFIITN
jgi:hypothetical protein